MKVGIARESAPGERRVALVPELIAKYKAAGLEVLVEAGAGSGALIPDGAYAGAGATVVSTDELYALADATLRVRKPTPAEVARRRAGRAVVGLLTPLIDPQTAQALATRGAIAISLDALPRTLSSAQSMDALSSQANVAGYKAVGATLIVLQAVRGAPGGGGYARALTPEEQTAQQDELNGHIAAMDVVITTAQVPGRRPPLLVTAAAVAGMKSGSVIVDMAASALGGNVELSRPGETVVTENGVSIIAGDTLPATMPAGASAFYARNIFELVRHFVKDGALALDFSDEITAATVIAHGGAVVQEATRQLLEPAAAPALAPAPATTGGAA